MLGGYNQNSEALAFWKYKEQGSHFYSLHRVDSRKLLKTIKCGAKKVLACFVMFEFPALPLPTNLGQPMHSPSALTEHVLLNLA